VVGSATLDPTGETDEAPRLAAVVVPLVALATVPAVEDRVDRHPIARREVGHALADLPDDAAELVAHGDRKALAGDGMGRLVGDEDRSRRVLVEVGPADATGADLDPDLSGVDRRRFDVLDADVLSAVISGCSHHAFGMW